jgi:hypothetical protein
MIRRVKILFRFLYYYFSKAVGVGKGRINKKLMFKTCLQDLSCSKNPSELTFTCSLWG